MDAARVVTAEDAEQEKRTAGARRCYGNRVKLFPVNIIDPPRCVFIGAKTASLL